jgi:hypothetical protein
MNYNAIQTKYSDLLAFMGSVASKELQIQSARNQIDALFDAIVDGTIGDEDNNVILVDSATGSDDNTGVDSWDNALASVNAAYALCTANNGDKILLAPGHTEDYTTTGNKLSNIVAGVDIISLGHGSERATFTFSHVDATFTIDEDGTRFWNCLFVAGIDSVVTFGTISGDDCALFNCEGRDATDVEVITDFMFTGDRPTVFKYFKNGYTSGNANDCTLSFNGCAGLKIINCDFQTKAITGVIEFVTAASTKVVIENCKFFVSGTTDLSKNIVDTIGTSEFGVNNCFDSGAGSSFSGNDSGIAVDDVGVVAADVVAIKAVTDVLPDAGALTALLADVTAIKGYVDTEIATIDAVVDAIKVVTDNIPDTGALTTLSGKIDTIDGLIDAVKLITDALPDAGALSSIASDITTVDGLIDAIKLITDALPDAGALTSLAQASDLATSDGKIDAIKAVTDVIPDAGALTALLGNIVAIKAITDVMPDAGALTALISDISDILVDTGTSLPATLSTIAGYLDSEIADILADTATTIPGLIADLEAKVDTVDGLIDAIKLITDALPNSGALTDLATASNLALVKTEVDKVETPSNACKRQAGKMQIFEKNITAAANAGSTTVGTITTAGIIIEKVILKSNGVTTVDLTSAAIKGGASAVIEFIDAATAVKASIDVDDEQLKYEGAVALDTTKTIIIDLQGTGATAVDLDVIIMYRAISDGGYLV